ncbi:MAG: hypothetical protein GX158_11130 [Bacteroidales bacterium]|jgi:hypothetical protein|nr:hypothetical protein [Bacteroidales bacterium]
MKKRTTNLKIMLSGMIIFVFTIMPFSLNGQAGKVNFSGSWALNADKSTFGPGPGGQAPQGQRPGGGFAGGNFVVSQEAGQLTVERTRGDQAFTSKYSLDGRESINSTGRGESRSTASWLPDGKTLRIVTTRTFSRGAQDMEIKTTEEWTLSAANVLTIVSTSSTPGGERKTTMVYDKK